MGALNFVLRFVACVLPFSFPPAACRRARARCSSSFYLLYPYPALLMVCMQHLGFGLGLVFDFGRDSACAICSMPAAPTANFRRRRLSTTIPTYPSTGFAGAFALPAATLSSPLRAFLRASLTHTMHGMPHAFAAALVLYAFFLWVYGHGALLSQPLPLLTMDISLSISSLIHIVWYDVFLHDGKPLLAAACLCLL